MKSIIDDVLERYMGLPEFEFVWASEEALSAQEQATIWATYLNAGVLTVDEVRAELGREPLPQQEQDDESPPSDNRLPEQLSQQENDQSQESEIDKLGKAKRPISEDEAAALIEAFLNEQADDVAEQIHALLQDLDIDFNAEDLQAELNRVADLVSGSLDFAKWAALVAIMAPILQETAQQAAHKALIDVIAEPAIGMGTAIRSRAVAWANERAAEMVGMKWIEGKLIQNPNAEWQITEGTRDMIRQAVKEAMTHGDSPQQLASRLKQSHAFSKWRSQTIARTEMARADGMGTYIGWVESGLVGGKQWITAEDDKVSEICNANHDAGVIGLHEYFPSGDLMQPSHPNCRCTVVAVLNEDLGKAYNPNQPRDKNGRWTSGNVFSPIAIIGNELGEWKTTEELRNKARAYAKENLAGHSFTNNDTGYEISVSMSGIRHTTNGAQEPLLKTIPALPEIIKVAKFSHEEPDKHKDPNIKKIEKYTAPIEIDGQSHTVILTVKHHADGIRYYDHGFIKK